MTAFGHQQALTTGLADDSGSPGSYQCLPERSDPNTWAPTHMVMLRADGCWELMNHVRSGPPVQPLRLRDSSES